MPDLYANPNTGRFIIEATLPVTSPDKEASYEVLNGIGQLIDKGTVAVSGHKLKREVVLGSVPAGNYFIRITAGDARVIEKFVVQQ